MKWSSPLFNLALAQFQRDELDEARRNVDLALARAFEQFAPLASLDAREMHWYETAAKLKADEPLLARIHAEKKSRAGAKQVERVERGQLPDRLGAVGG